MEIESDPNKAISNFKKHGISFEKTRQIIILDEYDFSKGKRAKDVPHLAKLQEQSKGKTRITIMIDNDVLSSFRSKANDEGLGYQTLINKVLKAYTKSTLLDEALLHKVIREELSNERNVTEAPG